MRRISPLIFLLAASVAQAQGFLPRASTTTAAAQDASPALLIGDTVPESLPVIGSDGKARTLLSYKAPTEDLVVTFFSARCDAEQSLWPELRRLNDHYKDWRVSFVAVNASAPEMLPELKQILDREKLPWPLLQDNRRLAATWMKITKTPEILILDDFGVLKYRGPVEGAKNALDIIIGHVDTVQDPEPPMTEGCTF